MADEPAEAAKGSTPIRTLVRENPQGSLQRYEANEHKYIGDLALGKFFDAHQDLKIDLQGIIDAATKIIDLKVVNLSSVKLTAGEWVALAGDFYGIPAAPISGLPNEAIDIVESERRFEAAYNTLALIQAGSIEEKELKELIDAITAEEKVVIEAQKPGSTTSVPEAIHQHAASSNSKFATITANNILLKFLIPHLPLAIVGLTVYTRYLELAVNNFDHFGCNAEIAYKAGHQVALETARKGCGLKAEGREREAIQYLTKSITQELFACHFLTDLFAAGHMRVPRKELAKVVVSTKWAGLLSMMMHNEDGEEGLTVSSVKHSEPWLAKGDGCLYEGDTATNRERVVETVTIALTSVYTAYLGPSHAIQFNFYDYIPDCKKYNNGTPLFRFNTDDDKVYRRDDLSSRKTVGDSNSWVSLVTLTKLWFFKRPPDESKIKDLETILGDDRPLELAQSLLGDSAASPKAAVK